MASTKATLNTNSIIFQELEKSSSVELTKVKFDTIQINPRFKELTSWIQAYIGPATAQLLDLTGDKVKAVKDENRNAVVSTQQLVLDGRTYFLSIKGCGAYEDLFFGNELTPDRLKQICHDSRLISKINQLSTGLGSILGESWMGESPYGAQGEENANDELKVGLMAGDAKNHINGAYICPIIGIGRLPKNIEQTARQFYWCRTHPEPFFQVLRLVPSTVRLYFESQHVISEPETFFHLFDIHTADQVEKFELNFIKSGFALLSLFTRSSKVEKNQISGLIYQDVWMDKDAIVAPDGIIHFADLEGLVWKTVPKDQYLKLQTAEWQKLFFEFFFALIKVDQYRYHILQQNPDWPTQRKNLSFLIQMALDQDIFLLPHMRGNSLYLQIEHPTSPNLGKVDLPILEELTI